MKSFHNKQIEANSINIENLDNINQLEYKLYEKYIKEYFQPIINSNFLFNVNNELNSLLNKKEKRYICISEIISKINIIKNIEIENLIINYIKPIIYKNINILIENEIINIKKIIENYNYNYSLKNIIEPTEIHKNNNIHEKLYLFVNKFGENHNQKENLTFLKSALKNYNKYYTIIKNHINFPKKNADEMKQIETVYLHEDKGNKNVKKQEKFHKMYDVIEVIKLNDKSHSNDN